MWGFLAISMGAFGAHGLEGPVQSAGYDRPAAFLPSGSRRTSTPPRSTTCIVPWRFWQSAFWPNLGRGGAALQAAGWLFLLGSLVFSGSLYVLATTGLRWLGAITPIGGVAMIAAWVALAVAAGSFHDVAPEVISDYFSIQLFKNVGGVPPASVLQE